MTTFPFLKIAREHDVPYPVVVRLSETLPKMISSNLTDQEVADMDNYPYPVLFDDIINAVCNERERRKAQQRKVL